MDKRIIIGIVIVLAVVCLLAYMILPVPVSVECLENQTLLIEELEAVNYCSVTEDCEAQALYCPFECWVFANREANFSALKERIDLYGSECGVCQLACAEIPPKPECIQGKCVVT